MNNFLRAEKELFEQHQRAMRLQKGLIKLANNRQLSDDHRALFERQACAVQELRADLARVLDAWGFDWTTKRDREQGVS